MQQLKIEHKNTTKKDRRPGKGWAMALFRRIYRLQNTNNMYYIESETRDEQYYFVKFKSNLLEECFCSCRDNSIRGLKCKHLFAIEFAIKWGTIKDTDKLPEDVKLYDSTTIAIKPIQAKSYKDDDYSF